MHAAVVEAARRLRVGHSMVDDVGRRQTHRQLTALRVTFDVPPATSSQELALCIGRQATGPQLRICHLQRMQYPLALLHVNTVTCPTLPQRAS